MLDKLLQRQIELIVCQTQIFLAVMSLVWLGLIILWTYSPYRVLNVVIIGLSTVLFILCLGLLIDSFVRRKESIVYRISSNVANEHRT